MERMTYGYYITELTILQSAQRAFIAENDGKNVNYYATKIRALIKQYNTQSTKKEG